MDREKALVLILAGAAAPGVAASIGPDAGIIALVFVLALVCVAWRQLPAVAGRQSRHSAATEPLASPPLGRFPPVYRQKQPPDEPATWQTERLG